ncbi:hypothetical protein QQF64_034635 [Cirrhinus molitorella]|uniref:AIG1-type G domain-containing protein n=1 Tax=Cirrhinus molitorella TaxID=172907 RepID=A0ABR3L0S7_9TELE
MPQNLCDPVIAAYGHARSRSWSTDAPPNFSEVTPLRIVLLGKSVSENSRVGNFILGRAAFDSEAPPGIIERLRGRLKDRHVIIINSPQLLQTNISDHQITQTVRESVYLSDPGPHVFIVILQHNDFTKEHLRRVKIVLKEFSDEAIKRTIVITTDDAEGASMSANELIQELNTECGGGHLQLDHKNEEWCSILLIEEEEEDSVADDDGKPDTQKKEARGFLHNIQKKSSFSTPDLRPELDRARRTVHTSRKQKLCVVLCGSDARLKNFTSKLIRGKKKCLLPLLLKDKECAKRDEELHGRLISLVELPSLTRLSEEEVMRQTHQSLSLCDSGVHVFLLIIPDAPLTDADKAEMEMIQRTFSSRIKNHLMVLIIQERNMLSKLISSKTQMCLQSFEGRQFALEKGSQARVELERNKHRAEIEELRRSMKKTQSTEGLTHSYAAVRIVLLGKTAHGGSFYTSEMFQQVEKNIKEEQDRIMKEKEEEIKRKEEELRAKYEAEIEQMKKENERERQEMQNELRKREEEFKNR